MPINTMTSWLEDWDLSLQTGTVSEETRIVYNRGCRQFIAWAADTHPEVVAPDQVEKRLVEEWMRHLLNTVKMAPATRRLRLLAVRFWFDYLTAEDDAGVTANRCVNLSDHLAETLPASSSAANP